MYGTCYRIFINSAEGAKNLAKQKSTSLAGRAVKIIL